MLLFSHEVVSNSFLTLWTIAHQPPLSMGFPRQECWSGLPFLSPGDLPNPRIKPRPPILEAEDALTSEPPGKPVFKWNMNICSPIELQKTKKTAEVLSWRKQ